MRVDVKFGGELLYSYSVRCPSFFSQCPVFGKRGGADTPSIFENVRYYGKLGLGEGLDVEKKKNAILPPK